MSKAIAVVVTGLALAFVVAMAIVFQPTPKEEPKFGNLTEKLTEQYHNTKLKAGEGYPIDVLHSETDRSRNLVEGAHVHSYLLLKTGEAQYEKIDSGNHMYGRIGTYDDKIYVLVEPTAKFITLNEAKTMSAQFRIESIEWQTIELGSPVDGWLIVMNTTGYTPEDFMWGYTRVTVSTFWDVVGDRTDIMNDPVWTGSLINYAWWYVDHDGDIYRCCNATAHLIHDGNTVTAEDKDSMILIHYYWPAQSGSLWRDNAYAAMTPYIEQGYSYHSEAPYDETIYGKRYEIKLAKNPPAQ